MRLANQNCNCGYQLHQCNNSPMYCRCRQLDEVKLSELRWTHRRHKWAMTQLITAVVSGARAGRHDNWLPSDWDLTVSPHSTRCIIRGRYRSRFQRRRPTWLLQRSSLWHRRQPCSFSAFSWYRTRDLHCASVRQCVVFNCTNYYTVVSTILDD